MSGTQSTAADNTVERLIKPLVQRLLAADSFEDGAAIILPVMLQLVSQVLKQSPFGDTSAVSRAMIHLRPEGGYRGLVVLEAGAKSISLPYENPSLLPSATAWRWAEKCKAAISVDVVKGTAKPLAAGNESAQKIDTKSLSFDSGETVQRLLGRHATHLLVIPMRGNNGKVHGMISIEADCRAAVGEDYFWKDCSEALQLIADISTPSLINLPQKKTPDVKTHALLPVVGKAMANLVAVLNVFVQQNETLLITGPSGAGKSRIAEWCHAESSRSKTGELVTIDLQTIPEDMQMAELFGWKRGAFTGAVNDHKGCVAQADKGTLFIDEIDKLSMKAQAGLLQLLETKKYRILGDGAGGGTREADVRFLVGTNANLEEAVADGRFREDLYYRINILPVRLPALKERADEIPQWADFMAQRKHKEAGLAGDVEVSAETKLLLSRHQWPGNLRQLDNVIRRAYAMALVEQGITDHISIQQQHVDRALGMEGQEESTSLVTSLRRAAQAFVDEAQAMYDKGQTMDLTHAAAFQGFVLSEALNRLTDRKEVFLMFGKEKAVESRNYHKELKRELFRAEECLNSLGHQGDSTLHMQIKDFKD